MVMPLWYDQLVEKLAREREEGNKGMLDKNGNSIDPNAPKRTQFEATMIAMGAQEASQSGYVTKSGRHYKSKPGRRPK